MFCPKCGTNINDGRYCPSCGYCAIEENINTNVNGNVAASLNSTYVKNQLPRNKLMVIVTICIVAVVLVGTFAMLIHSLTNNGKHAIQKYYNAIENQSASAVLSCVPNDFLKDLMDDYDVSKKDIKNALNKYLQDDWTSDWVYDDYEPGDNIKVKFVETEKEDGKSLKSFQNDLADIGFLEIDRFNPDKVRKAEVFHVDFYDGDDYYKIIYAFKYEGTWYCNYALGLVEHATRLYA